MQVSEPLINDYCPIQLNSQNLTKINLVFLASFEAGCHPVVMYNSPLSLGQWVTMDYEMAIGIRVKPSALTPCTCLPNTGDYIAVLW